MESKIFIISFQGFNPSLELVKWIVIAQFIFIALHIGFVFILQPLEYIFSMRKNRDLLMIKKRLLHFSEMQVDVSSLQLPSHLCKMDLLIEAIRDIDQEKQDSHWDNYRNSIFDRLLFSLAQKLTYSRRWTNRMKASGCFLLFSKPKNEPYVLHLLNDSVPLIQYSAAYSATKIGSVLCINAIIDKMNQVDRFLRHPFREALLQGNDKVFMHIEERMKIDKRPYTQVSCLEVLSLRMNTRTATLAKDNLGAPSKNLRIAAIRALGHYPDPTSVSSLIPLLEDPEWEVRAQAARSLGYLKAKEALSALTMLLKDKVWWVRMNGAMALKRLGQEGRKRLEMQTPQEDKFAYEISQYVLPLNINE